MKIQVANQTLNLSKSHFISQGGEGSVYVVNNTAYKVYHDRSNLIPIAKISELSKIQDEYVISPQQVIYNRNRPVGYSMKYIAKAHPLCKLFTRAFKQRNKLELSDIARLVERMRDSVYNIHKENILMVDCNELNFLVSEDFRSVYFIDTDSYQTPSFSATAIMDSVRDRHTQIFDENSDWFSWGIVTFQMFLGIHPYKGKHPELKTLEDRMKANVSVFNAKVSTPKTAGSITSIPYTLRVWYENIFEKGLRCPPPGPDQSVVAIDSLGHRQHFIEDMDVFRVTLNKTLRDDIIKVDFSGTSEVIWTTKKVYKGNQEFEAPLDSYLHVVEDKSYLVWLEEGKLQVMDLQTKDVDPTEIEGTALMSREGRVYVHNGEIVSELIKTPKHKNLSHVTKQVAQVLPHATFLFPGVIIQNFLGSWYMSIPYAKGLCVQMPLHQIPKNCRVISARAERQVLVVTYFYRGFYNRKVLVYDERWQNADEWDEFQVQNLEPNFTVLNNNVCVYLNDQDEMEVFHAVFTKTKPRRVLKDSSLNHNLKLCSVGKNAKFFQDKQLYSILIKNP